MSLELLTEEKSGQTARLDLIDMIPDLQRALIGEQATLRNMTWSPVNLVTLQAINRFKVAQHVPIDGSISYKELSALCSVNESQLRRLIRHAMTNRIFCEPEKDQVMHTAASKLLVEDPRMDAWVFFLTDYFWPATARSVDAFQKWPGSQNPKEVGVSLQYGRDTTWFAEIARADRGIESFRQAMEIVNDGEGWQDSYLVDNYPWGEINNGVVVDIGGSNGHTSVAIAGACPKLQFVVQDLHTEGNHLPELLKTRIKFINHDMLTSQPIKNADVYLFRAVLHNHPDTIVVKALQSLIPALKPNSKIIIQDFGLTDPGQGRLADESYERMMDIMMMSLMNGKERGLEEWKALFEQADPRFAWNGGTRPDGSRLWIIESTWEP
ncbi:O-methyltransferase [Mollisia scopiformis]|uniref:O-methyltransferase n=1 Tax=Mollisia scopiformis TaxID=149040 RepID=A0A194X240_MOLSC|nr:O-methyltransferase [Mollisia scopiformis]KUJ14270.1 O-methyltransferase [Mollisia scopiformis]